MSYYRPFLLLISFFLSSNDTVLAESLPTCSELEWEKAVEERYQSSKENYRIFDETTPEQVKNFYRLNHQHQTFEFVLQKKAEFLSLNRSQMEIWEAIELLNTLVDESDPDINLPQCYHLYQTAEALRKDGYPRWLILTGFIHDLGKILACHGEPQWAVVGDTFPLGCAFAPKVVFPEYFAKNTDIKIQDFQSILGIYSEGCGFENLTMSWGHDEYLYQVVKDYLPSKASYIIRFHSFYAAHREGGYAYFMNDTDKEMMPWLQLFSQYDLYSKLNEPLDLDALEAYYQELVAEFFPAAIHW